VGAIGREDGPGGGGSGKGRWARRRQQWEDGPDSSNNGTEGGPSSDVDGEGQARWWKRLKGRMGQAAATGAGLAAQEWEEWQGRMGQAAAALGMESGPGSDNSGKMDQMVAAMAKEGEPSGGRNDEGGRVRQWEQLQERTGQMVAAVVRKVSRASATGVRQDRPGGCGSNSKGE
jgi:hypothetical protein